VSRFVIALLLVVACKKEEKPATPPPAPADPQVAIDAAPPVAVDASEAIDAGLDDADVPADAPRSKGTSTCQPAECYMPAEKACYVPDPNQGICGKPGAVCRRCKPR
jgi:hypothetical protein